jgi:hypothetical protein
MSASLDSFLSSQHSIPEGIVMYKRKQKGGALQIEALLVQFDARLYIVSQFTTTETCEVVVPVLELIVSIAV